MANNSNKATNRILVLCHSSLGSLHWDKDRKEVQVASTLKDILNNRGLDSLEVGLVSSSRAREGRINRSNSRALVILSSKDSLLRAS